MQFSPSGSWRILSFLIQFLCGSSRESPRRWMILGLVKPAISRFYSAERSEIWSTLLSHMGCRLSQVLRTLNDLERRNALFAYHFYRATRVLSADYAVARCRRVTRRYCVETAKHIKLFSPPSTILVFPCQTSYSKWLDYVLMIQRLFIRFDIIIFSHILRHCARYKSTYYIIYHLNTS